MRTIFSIILSYMMYVHADNNTNIESRMNIVQFLGQGIQKEIQFATNPIEETIVNIGSASSVVDSLGRTVQKEVQTVKQPVDLSIAYVGSSQCQHVKKLIGVSYEQIKGQNEPNLNDLTLVYKTKSFTTIINITAAAASLRQARTFDKDERLVIFVHGFTDDPTKDSFTNISRSYMEKGRVSIIALDGSSLIGSLYLRSSTYVRFIGEKLGQVLAAIYQQGQDPALIHIIGHSLGAHISSFAGKAFQGITGKRIGRITGLDPAGPCFSHVDPELQLMKADAAFVDVIHTDGGVYGITKSVGHKDYYPNSGSLQPNCLFQTCSHSRAWLLYGESVVTPLAFPAVRCKDWDAFKRGECEITISYMGYADEPGVGGDYYLQTGGSYLYGLGGDGIKYRNTEGIVESIGNLFG